MVTGLTIGSLAIGALAGCADFGPQDRDRAAGPFTSNDVTYAPQSESPPPPELTPGPEPTGPCADPDPAVIITCLPSTAGVMPGDQQGESAVVAVRTTGQIVTAKRGTQPRVLATVPVDASGDGGLIDFAPSPTYDQDRLIYALISTASDNRVVRIAPGDVPKPILTGIPRGATGNMGSMFFRGTNELIVATGNAGRPALADDPSSLAGKVLSITSLSSGPNPRPKVLASGFGSNVSLCPSADTGALYVADQAASADRVQVVEDAGPKVLWTWPDKPQIGGCAAAAGSIFVSTTRTKRIEAINEPTRERPSINKPVVVLERRYGALGRMTALPNGLLQFATVNKGHGKPVKTDDRVVRFLPQGATEDRM